MPSLLRIAFALLRLARSLARTHSTPARHQRTWKMQIDWQQVACSSSSPASRSRARAWACAGAPTGRASLSPRHRCACAEGFLERPRRAYASQSVYHYRCACTYIHAYSPRALCLTRAVARGSWSRTCTCMHACARACALPRSTRHRAYVCVHTHVSRVHARRALTRD